MRQTVVVEQTDRELEVLLREAALHWMLLGPLGRIVLCVWDTDELLRQRRA